MTPVVFIRRPPATRLIFKHMQMSLQLIINRDAINGLLRRV